MTTASSTVREEIVDAIAVPNAVHAKMAKGPGKVGTVIFGTALAVGIAYAAVHLVGDLLHVHATSYFPLGARRVCEGVVLRRCGALIFAL